MEAAPNLPAAMRRTILEIVLSKGYERRDEPFRLASGAMSNDYVDGKRAMAAGADLRAVAEAAAALGDQAGGFDLVGGPTMGADPIAHAVAVISDKSWFTVRRAPKDHGKPDLIVGAQPGPGTRVLMVEDVITTGGSMLQAYDTVKATGARVVLAVALLDRGKVAESRFREAGVMFRPLLTFEDLGIDPVGAL